jgi:hypothetical protein
MSSFNRLRARAMTELFARKWLIYDRMTVFGVGALMLGVPSKVSAKRTSYRVFKSNYWSVWYVLE